MKFLKSILPALLIVAPFFSYSQEEFVPLQIAFKGVEVQIAPLDCVQESSPSDESECVIFWGNYETAGIVALNPDMEYLICTPTSRFIMIPPYESMYNYAEVESDCIIWTVDGIIYEQDPLLLDVK